MMPPLIPEPVILRVVRLVERVEEGLKTSDGGLLREVAGGHPKKRYRTVFGHALWCVG